MNQEELLALYPWPENTLGKIKPVEALYRIPIKGSPDIMWRWLSDTSRFNRALGMAEREEREENGRRIVKTSALGKVQEWVEYPWKWVAGKNMIVDREYLQGMAYFNHSIFHFEVKEDGNCDLLIYMGFTPSGLFGRILLTLGLPQILKGIEKLVNQMDEDQVMGFSAPSFFQKKEESVDEEGIAFLEKKIQFAKQEGLEDDVAEKIFQLVLEGDPLDLYRMRVKEFLAEWNMDFEKVLRNMLIATHAGIFKMSWDVICPSCLGTRSENSSLSDLLESDNCEACELEFETSQESAVEVTFKINPEIRKIKKMLFCAAEPAKKAHIKCQWTLDPNAIAAEEVSLPKGNYNLRALGGSKSFKLSFGDGELSKIDWDASESRSSQTAEQLLLELKNNEIKKKTFIIEEKQRDPNFLHPREVFSFREFRTLFSNEELGDGVQLYLGNQTILFTDVVGSTKFYESTGDTDAFRQIKDHFKTVFQFIEEEKGVVVKTIGDAVMASFPHPSNALRATEKMHRFFDPDYTNFDFRLRASAHTGTVIAVNQNTGIDYFGSTVNISAKLQAVAEDAQLGVSEEFAREIDASELENWNVQETSLKISGRGEIPAIVYTLKT